MSAGSAEPFASVAASAVGTFDAERLGFASAEQVAFHFGAS